MVHFVSKSCFQKSLVVFIELASSFHLFTSDIISLNAEEIRLPATSFEKILVKQVSL